MKDFEPISEEKLNKVFIEKKLNIDCKCRNKATSERNFGMKKYVAKLCDTAILEFNEKEFEDTEERIINYNGNRTRCKCILVKGQCDFFVLYPKNMFDIQEV